jgi:hypothetical protein
MCLVLSCQRGDLVDFLLDLGALRTEVIGDG